MGEQTRLAESARAQVALLNRQLAELRAQIARVGAALDASEAAARDKDVQIANLGNRLNAALAARVEELQRYRSDFFGRLRDLLGERADEPVPARLIADVDRRRPPIPRPAHRAGDAAERVEVVVNRGDAQFD